MVQLLQGRPRQLLLNAMKTKFAVLWPYVGIMAFLLYVIYVLDNWLGVLAFKVAYVSFSVLFTIVVILLIARGSGNKRLAVAIGLVTLTLLLSPYLISTPSERILRGVLIDVQPGMTSNEVETIIREAYQNSGYEMPHITREENLIHVSLFPQESGNATGATFHLSDDIVVKGAFARD